MCEKRIDEVHEALAVEVLRSFILGMCLPEGVVSARAEQLIVGIFRVSLRERGRAGEHDEEDDS